MLGARFRLRGPKDRLDLFLELRAGFLAQRRHRRLEGKTGDARLAEIEPDDPVAPLHRIDVLHARLSHGRAARPF